MTANGGRSITNQNALRDIIRFKDQQTVFTGHLLKAMAPNPGFDYNELQRMYGAVVAMVQVADTTWTIAAVNTCRAQLLGTLSSLIAGYFTDNDRKPKFENFDYYLHFESANNFVVQGFVSILENGETIAATDGNTDNLTSVIDTATGSETKIVYYGPIHVAQKFRENNADRYQVNDFGFNLADIVNSYANHYQDALLNEEDALVLCIGAVIHGATGTAVLMSGWNSIAYFQEKIDLTKGGIY